MSGTVVLPPSAASLSSSMRDLGYSIEAAVADLVDNSIAAGATEVKVYCPTSDAEPSLAVVDNGHGMDRDELLEAMRHGSRGMKGERRHVDLGRYGLGLKTASLSQCRRLTVISRTKGETTAMAWDLDLIDASDSWLLQVLSSEEASANEYSDQIGDQGTAVVWSKLDRVIDHSTKHTSEEQLAERVRSIESHLSLVFHRFIEGEFGKSSKLSIYINGHPISATDPFLRDNPATQKLNDVPATVSLPGGKVELRAYILPHFSKLRNNERTKFRDWKQYVSHQGAYVYRNGRLLAWGDWFQAAPKSEQTKYARVQVDFDSSLDDFWAIDVMKSKAKPPAAVKVRLKRLLDGEILNRSSNVHRGRGRRLFQANSTPLWERYADRDNVRYQISLSHPLVESLMQEISEPARRQLAALLSAAATSLPVEAVYSDFATRPNDIQKEVLSNEQLIAILCFLRSSLFGNNKFEAERFATGAEGLGLKSAKAKDVIDRFLKGDIECE